jgi:hypothetical protein
MGGLYAIKYAGCLARVRYCDIDSMLMVTTNFYLRNFDRKMLQFRRKFLIELKFEYKAIGDPSMNNSTLL